MNELGRRTVTDEELRALEPLSSTLRAPAGTPIMRAGDHVSCAYLVLEGQVALCHRHPVMGRHIIAIKRGGELFGDAALLVGIPMPWDAIATRATRLLELDGAGLIEVIRQSPDLALRWLGFVGERLIDERRRLAAMTTSDLSGRVAHVLLALREDASRDPPVVKVSHEALAQLLGARRQSISRVLRRFRRDGVVGSGYRSITIIDLQALRGIADPLPGQRGGHPAPERIPV